MEGRPAKLVEGVLSGLERWKSRLQRAIHLQVLRPERRHWEDYRYRSQDLEERCLCAWDLVYCCRGLWLHRSPFQHQIGQEHLYGKVGNDKDRLEIFRHTERHIFHLSLLMVRIEFQDIEDSLRIFGIVFPGNGRFRQ